MRGLSTGTAACLLALGVGLAMPARAANCLDEARWQQLQRQSGTQPVLLYVWSPRMVLSAVHAHEVARVARQEGLRLVAVHDHRVPHDEVDQARKRLQKQLPAAAAALQASMPLCADSLLQQDAYRHFPTAWVVHKGSFHPLPLVAAMPMPYWREGIRLRMVAADRTKGQHATP